MQGWWTALRIARREARRSKGRSALVVALIGLPMLGLTFAAVSYDMMRLTPEERVTRILGAADAELRWVATGPVWQEDAGAHSYGLNLGTPETGPPDSIGAEDIEALLPAGSRAVPRVEGAAEMPTATGIGLVDWLGIDVADPIMDGSVSLVRGEAPGGGAQEVAVTAAAATRLGVDLGDRVEVPGSGTYTVVGLVEFPGVDEAFQLKLTSEVLLFHPAQAPDGGLARWRADTPGPVTWEQVTALNQRGVVVHSRAVVLDPPPELAGWDDPPPGMRTFGAGVLVAGLAVLEIVLLAGPAFTVGARRRQRDLALVAACGGTPAQLRRIVLADGVVLGALAAVIGLAAGIVSAFAARPLVEVYLVGARAGGHRVFPLALAAIVVFAVGTAVLAALVPAWTAARQSVVQALAGRRGVTRSRRLWLVVGTVLVTVGVAVTALGAWQVSATVVLAGLIFGQLGLAVCTPALIGLIARLGPRLTLPARVALRDTARNRSAAAPAVAAVMAAVAGAVGAGVITVALTSQQDNSWARDHAPGTAIIFHGAGYADFATHDALEHAARATLPVADIYRQWTMGCAGRDSGSPDPQPAQAEDEAEGWEAPDCWLPAAVVPEEQVCPFWEQAWQLPEHEQAQARQDPRCAGDYRPYRGIRVDDGTALPALLGSDAGDLEAAAAMLRGGGAVVTDPRLLTDGEVTLAVMDGADAPGRSIAVPAYLATTGIDRDGAIISPQAAGALGMATKPEGEMLVATTRQPTQAEQDAFYAALAPLRTGAMVVPAPGNRFEPVLLVLTVAAIGIALGAAAIATGLAATDRRSDLSALAAVGASPQVRRWLSLSQSGVIAGLGTALGMAAGLGASTAVLVALNQSYARVWPGPDPMPLDIPWTQLAALLLIPAVAMGGAGLLTRSRLPIERRLS